jgi:hypothetical protein
MLSNKIQLLKGGIEKMIIDKIKAEVESLEELEFKELNGEQKQYLRNNFNAYVNFKYAQDDYYDNIIFICSKETFKSLEHYLGFEYERESIEYKIEINNKVIVSYSESERVENLIVNLESLRVTE